jgi:hypothetical protein
MARASFILTACFLFAAGALAQVSAVQQNQPSQPSQILSPQPSAVPDASWQKFVQEWATKKGTELRVQTPVSILRCHLNTINASVMVCDQRLADRILFPAPGGHLEIPKGDVYEVRVGGREKSTLLGALIGFGAGLSIAATHSGVNDGTVLASALVGGIGAIIGHILPARGHIIYSQQPSPNQPLTSKE